MESKESVESVKPTKTKRVMTETQLEQLRIAREKAAQVRRQLGDIKRKEKNIKQQTLENRIKDLTIQEEKLKKPKKPPTPPESESESESEEEEELPPPVKQKPKKTVSKPQKIKQKVEKMQDHELASNIARDEYRSRILKDTYKQAYASLFPNQLYNPYA